MDIRKQIYEFIEMYVDTTEPKKLCSSIQDLVEELAESKVKNIEVIHCSIQLKGGKYTQAFIDYVEKYFKHRPKVYDWVSKDGKREYTHKQLCKYYEKAMLESPFIV